MIPQLTTATNDRNSSRSLYPAASKSGLDDGIGSNDFLPYGWTLISLQTFQTLTDVVQVTLSRSSQNLHTLSWVLINDPF